MAEIITRADAIERGAVTYFTGEPCRHGHTAERYTLGSQCIECVRIASDRQREHVKAKRQRAQEIILAGGES